MKNITIITFLLISNLIFSQEDKPVLCYPMFNYNLFSFEEEELKNSDSNLSFLIDENYQINFDLSEFIDGKRSVCIKGLNQNAKTYATISLKIPLKIKKNSKIDLSVWVKTDSLNGKNSGTMLRLMGYRDVIGATPSVLEFSKTILKGSEKWTEISLSTILKEDVNLIILSGLMQGKGRAWFDNFKLKINEEIINDILFFKDDKEANKIKSILNNYVTPLEINNLKQVSNFINNQDSKVRIIGLGEATHGTSEVYNYKIEIIKSLIKNNGVRKIGLEAYYSNTVNLNTYILEGKGDLKKLIAEIGFWPYYTVEFKEFMIWLKDYNKNTNDKVSIIGIDSQPGGNSLEILTEKLKDNAHYSKLLNELKNDSTGIYQKIDISNTVYQKLIKDNQNENILMNAKELSQSYYLDQYEGLKYATIRDSLMAVNIACIEKELYSNEKMIYWAHDSHVQKKTGWTGGFLNQKYKGTYVNLGFLLGNGKYTAIDKESRKIDSDNLLTPIKCNSFEALMDMYNYPVLLFNNNSASSDPYLKNNLFDKHILKRDIGALETNDQFLFLGDNPDDIFDLLVYIKNSNPSQFLN